MEEPLQRIVHFLFHNRTFFRFNFNKLLSCLVLISIQVVCLDFIFPDSCQRLLHESQEILSYLFHFCYPPQYIRFLQSFAVDPAKVGPFGEKTNDASPKNMLYNIFLDLHQ